MINHFFGQKIDGKLGRFFGSYNDKEFDRIMEKLGGNLPKGFVAWHIDDEEFKRGSKRVDELKKLPTITEYNPFFKSGQGYANAEQYLLRAKEMEDLLSSHEGGYRD